MSVIALRSIVTSLIVLSSIALRDEAEKPRAGSARLLVTPGTSVEGEATTSEPHSHFFVAEAGQYVHLTVAPQAVPIVATLLGRARTVVAEARDPEGGDAPFHLSAPIERSGVHELRLVVSGAQARSARYRLTVDPPRTATQDDRLRVRAAQAYADAARLCVEQTAETAQQALKRFEEAREISHRIGDLREEAEALTGIGELQFGQGSTRAALGAVQDALALYRAAGDRRGEATTLNNLGAATWALGDARGARAYYDRALPIAHELGVVSLEGTIVSNIGSVHKNLGDAREALAFFERSLPLRRQAGDLAGESASLSNIGVAYRMLGERGRALAAYEAALPLARRANVVLAESVALQNLGALSLSVGDLERGKEVLGTALELCRRLGDRRGEGFVLGWLSHAQRLKGNYARAIALTNQELTLRRAIGDRYGEGHTLSYLGTLQRLQHEPAEARANLDAALRLQREVGDRFDETSTLIELAALRRDAGDLAAADGIPAEALTASRSLGDPGAEATALFHTARASYAWAITRSGMHAARLAPGPAITAAARAFHDLLAAPPSRVAADRDARVRRWHAAGAELTRLVLEPLAEHLDRERIVIVADGSLHYVPFAAPPEPRPGRPRSDGADAPPLVVHHEVVFLPSVTALGLLRERSPARGAGRTTVAVLADPVFEADDPRVETDGRSERLGATTAPPRDELLRAARDVGLPAAGPAFPRLPYSREEAEAILEAAAPGATLRALDFDASRATALSGRLAGYDIVHFATHGFVDDARPTLSGLVLSLVDRTGKPQDGFLRLRGLHALRLPVELVVLSGCRTGLGPEVRGEGILGIVRAFMHAGARRIVASVWDVDDRATAMFMKAFYEQMLTSGLSAPAALRAAQLALRSRERWADPFYWAPFVVHGEWN